MIPERLVGRFAFAQSRAFLRQPAFWKAMLPAFALTASLAVVSYFRLRALTTTDDQMTPARLAARGEAIGQRIRCRQQPIKIAGSPGLGDVVSENELVTALCAALPYWHPPAVPCAIHELKLWGSHFAFTKKMLESERTGDFLVRTLLNDKECRANTVSIGGSYLLDSAFGIHVVLQGSDDAIEYRAEGHYGQLLKALAESGVASDTPVTTSSGRLGSVADLYQDAVLRYSVALPQEFIACALAYWQPPQRTWVDQFGQEHTFDELLQSLLATALGEGSCGGTHVPYAVTTIIRVHERYPIISENTHAAARKWLAVLSRRLEQRWSVRAGWDRNWASEGEAKFLWGDELLDRITITGHHLEWMALAPSDVRPCQAVIRRAVLALLQDIRGLPALQFRSFKALLPTCHAARALSLMRGTDPFQTWLAYWKEGRLKRTDRGYAVKDLQQ
jgi:hypothetical protein